MLQDKELVKWVVKYSAKKFNRSENQTQFVLQEVCGGNYEKYFEYEKHVKKYYHGFLCFGTDYEYELDVASKKIHTFIDELVNKALNK